MAVITGYFPGDCCGLLGPQMAASIISKESGYECFVLAITRHDEHRAIIELLHNYFGQSRPIIGFSCLHGREDLFALAGKLKNEGAVTILAGPQAAFDFCGETGWEQHNGRFRGLAKHFTYALQGPAEQIIPLLNHLQGKTVQNIPGLIYEDSQAGIVQNKVLDWNENYLQLVDWKNIYGLSHDQLKPIKINCAQILQQIGCPYAALGRKVHISHPADISTKRGNEILVKGCSFCDIAADKGFYGILNQKTVISQIQSLPVQNDGRKIPFEIVNENPLPQLPALLKALNQERIPVSQINLIMRADWLLKGEEKLRQSLQLAKEMRCKIMAASVGFESFSDTILQNLNKGLNVSTNIQAIQLMRRLKHEIPDTWTYSRSEGAMHGFIHPTPWDTNKTWEENEQMIKTHALATDVLPEHSLPLIIHHASGLGDWIRLVEQQECIQYNRRGSIIEWWQVNSHNA